MRSRKSQLLEEIRNRTTERII